MANIYRGFSSDRWGTRRTFALSDIELVKRDLMIHIFTERGSRVMMPNFGTRIPIMAFEPNDPNTISQIREDLETVFEYDPRVQLINLQLAALTDNNAIIATATLRYIEFNVEDDLRIEIQSQ